MSTRRGVLAALGATALGGCAAFPRDRAAPTTNYGPGPQVDVDFSYEDATSTLDCVVDMGPTLTSDRVGRVVVARADGPNVAWVSIPDLPKRVPMEPRQSFPLEPGDSLTIEVERPPSRVSAVAWAPDGSTLTRFGSREFESDDDDPVAGGWR